ncbi:MAG: alpha/beta hydrolase [Acidimicrobiaceae bacterium]|nr:alpha/beta hydrolase [Acidimicrobiaceae bacterium]
MQHAGIWRDSAGDPAHPLIVLVHGSMDRSAGMLRLSRRLDDDHLVVRYDRRGYGRSSHHGPFTVEQHVADLVEVLEGRRAVLVGHSFGGNVALATAARHPHLVAGVAVYETPLSWEDWWPRNSAGSKAVAHDGDPADAAEVFMRRLIGDARWEDLPERTREIRRSEGAAMVGELADIRANAPWRYDEIRVPVVAGHGTTGSPHHQRGMAHLVEQVPGARLVVMDGCPHNAPNSHAERFRAEMVDPLLAMAGAPWG